MNIEQLKKSTINEINDYVKILEEAKKEKMPADKIRLFAMSAHKFFHFVEWHLAREAFGDHETSICAGGQPETLAEHLEKARNTIKRITLNLS